MFLGIFFLSLAYFSFVGMKRMAHYVFLARTTLWAYTLIASKPKASLMNMLFYNFRSYVQDGLGAVINVVFSPITLMVLYPIVGLGTFIPLSNADVVAKDDFLKLFLKLRESLRVEIPPEFESAAPALFLLYLSTLIKHDFKKVGFDEILAHAEKMHEAYVVLKKPDEQVTETETTGEV